MQQTYSFGDFDLTAIVTAPPYYENCYLVEHKPTGERVVIDPGSDADHIIELAGAPGGKVIAVWLTHGHPDHIGAARALQRAFKVGVRAHADERPVIEGAGRMASAMMGMTLELPENCDYFEGEPTWSLGGAAVRVIHTPGHTPGGVCYDFGDFVLTGDTLFNQGVGRTDFPGGSGPALQRSITRLLDLVNEGRGDAGPDLFSGHGGQWPAADAGRWWRSVGHMWF